MITALFSNIERALISNIQKTKSNIKIAVAWFTNPKLFEALLPLLNSEVSIEIILADDAINFSNKNIDFQQLINEGVEIKISRFPNLMHHKFCIIDDRLLITGSYNWTKSAEINNHENVIISNDLALVSIFKNQFLELKRNTERLISIHATVFNSYISKVEAQEELKLITDINVSNNYQGEKETNKEINEVTEEIENLLNKADLLYLQGKHQHSIDVCLKVIEIAPQISEAYEIISSSKWRQNKFKEQIEYAQKAIELDNKSYSAYNILGIGYSHIRNSQKSIENYQICIDAEPDGYIYYRNRAVSYLDLGTDLSIPKNLRDQFLKKANLDFHKIIELTNRLESSDNTYQLYFSRAVAYLNLDKIYPSKVDFLKAKELYEITDKSSQDTHEYKEIKQALKDIEKMKQTI